MTFEMPSAFVAEIRNEQLKDPEEAKIISSFENPNDTRNEPIEVISYPVEEDREEQQFVVAPTMMVLLLVITM